MEHRRENAVVERADLKIPIIGPPEKGMMQKALLFLLGTVALSHLLLGIFREPALELQETLIGFTPVYVTLVCALFAVYRGNARASLYILIGGTTFNIICICFFVAGPRPFLYAAIFNLILIGGATIGVRTGIIIFITFASGIVIFETVWKHSPLIEYTLLSTAKSRYSFIPLITTLCFSGIIVGFLIRKTTHLIEEVKEKGTLVKEAREALSIATEANSMRARQGIQLAEFASQQQEAPSFGELIQYYTEHVSTALNQTTVAVLEISGEHLLCRGLARTQDETTHEHEHSTSESINSLQKGGKLTFEQMNIIESMENVVVRRLDITDEFEGKVLIIHPTMEKGVDAANTNFLNTLGSLLLQGIQNLKTEMTVRETQKMEAVGILAKGVAHDFNNYLTTIQGNVDLSRTMEPNQGKNRERLEKIMLATKQASYLTRKLISVSSDPLSASLPHSLHKLIDQVVRLIEGDLPSNVQLSQQLHAPQETIRVDQHLLETAILNMLTNAIEAITPDAGTITIETFNISRQELPKSNRLIMRISDSGRGIVKDDLPQIFEPFFTTKSDADGTGLGLASVTELLEQSEATCEVSSEGDGTVFTLEFPLSVQFETLQPRSELPPSDLSLGDRELILLVEDDPRVRSTIVDMLLFSGFRVLEANNIAEAIQVLQSGMKIDLILSDILMPGGTGFELEREVKTIENPPPVILMTGFAHMNDYSDDLRILYKPFTMNQLIETVSKEFSEA